MALKDTLLAEFDHEMGTTRRLLERVPDAELAWKPHDRSMTLGRLAAHVASIPEWGGTILRDESFDLAAGPPQTPDCGSRSAILALFERSTAAARSGLDKTDAELMVRWALKRGDQEMFSLPRAAAFRSFVLNHVIHHRGQLSVYLRLRDIPLPPIYGPSADEAQ